MGPKVLDDVYAPDGQAFGYAIKIQGYVEKTSLGQALTHYEKQSFAKQDAAENEKYAENIADCYICQGSFPIADLEQLKSFPGKSGKCCKTTQKSGKNKKAPFVGPVEFIEQAPDKTYEK